MRDVINYDVIVKSWLFFSITRGFSLCTSYCVLNYCNHWIIMYNVVNFSISLSNTNCFFSFNAYNSKRRYFFRAYRPWYLTYLTIFLICFCHFSNSLFNVVRLIFSNSNLSKIFITFFNNCWISLSLFKIAMMINARNRSSAFLLK